MSLWICNCQISIKTIDIKTQQAIITLSAIVMCHPNEEQIINVINVSPNDTVNAKRQTKNKCIIISGFIFQPLPLCNVRKIIVRIV